MLGRLEIAGALLAPEDGDLFLDAFCDVYLCANAVDTHASWVGRDADAAKTTKTVCVLWGEVGAVRNERCLGKEKLGAGCD